MKCYIFYFIFIIYTYAIFFSQDIKNTEEIIKDEQKANLIDFFKVNHLTLKLYIVTWSISFSNG